jgi:hypothetical protein
MLILNAKWSCQGDEAQTAAGCVVLVYMQVNSRISIVILGNYRCEKTVLSDGIELKGERGVHPSGCLSNFRLATGTRKHRDKQYSHSRSGG